VHLQNQGFQLVFHNASLSVPVKGLDDLMY
jgi:hypothetical protein